jgi:hypothetical protein
MGKKTKRGRRLPHAARRGVQAMFDSEKPSSKKKRSCGNCSACCTVLGLRLDGPDGKNTVKKERHTPCQYLRKPKGTQKGGCGIYEARPIDCVAYKCYWLEGFGENRDRPDRLGMIADSSNGIIRGIHALTGIKAIAVHEVWPGANKDPRFRAAVTGMIQRDLAVLYQGTGNLPPVMALPKMMPKLQAALDTLNAAADTADEHATHTEPHAACPVCVGVCPAHGSEPLSICTVCQKVAVAQQPQHN